MRLQNASSQRFVWFYSSNNQQIKMEFFDSFEGNYLGFQEVVRNIGVSPSSSLILNNVRGKLMMDSSRQKMSDANKALIALRNHSDAERRRRERINAHLSTLRTLTPGTTKMDKAGLLGEVNNQVKSLRENATEATKGTVVPSDIDEVRVEEEEDPNDAASTSIRAASLRFERSRGRSASNCCEGPWPRFLP